MCMCGVGATNRPEPGRQRVRPAYAETVQVGSANGGQNPVSYARKVRAVNRWGTRNNQA